MNKILLKIYYLPFGLIVSHYTGRDINHGDLDYRTEYSVSISNFVD